jgi:hypothetical protein
MAEIIDIAKLCYEMLLPQSRLNRDFASSAAMKSCNLHNGMIGTESTSEVTVECNKYCEGIAQHITSKNDRSASMQKLVKTVILAKHVRRAFLAPPGLFSPPLLAPPAAMKLLINIVHCLHNLIMNCNRL